MPVPNLPSDAALLRAAIIFAEALDELDAALTPSSDEEEAA